MIHVRTLNRRAVVQRLLDGNTAAEQRVYDHPTDPRRVFPAISVEDVGEQQQMPTMPGTPDRIVERVQMLDITTELQQLGDWPADRDSLAAAVEALMLGAPFPGVRNVELMGYTPDSLPGEKPLAIGRHRFALTYMTRANAPSVAI